MRRLLPLLIAVLMIVPFSAAQEDEAVVAPDVSPALLEQLEALDARTVEIRGLQPLAEVERNFPTPEEVREYLQNVIDEELTTEMVFQSTLFYRALGFVDDSFDLPVAYLDLLSDQVAGFYDLETKEMNIILIGGEPLGDRLPVLEQITYVHEYVHALQDQHFDLTVLRESVPDDNIDASMALTSLIEGDAVAAMNDFTFALLTEDMSAMMELLTSDLLESAALPPSVPPIMEAELLAPYLDGLEFVEFLRRTGGWDAVDAAFANPPTSMMHIYNPQAYLDGVLPVDVTLSDALPALGDDWEAVTEWTLGIFYWREYLALEIPARRAQEAVSGWSGDRFSLYYDESTDNIAWVSRVVWEDAEARDLFQRVFAADFLGMTDAPDTCGETVVGVVCIVADGEQDVIIAGAESSELASLVIDTQR